MPNGNTINSVEVGTHKAYTYIDSDDIKERIAEEDDYFVKDSLFEPSNTDVGSLLIIERNKLRNK